MDGLIFVEHKCQAVNKLMTINVQFVQFLNVIIFALASTLLCVGLSGEAVCCHFIAQLTSSPESHILNWHSQVNTRKGDA